MTRTTNTHGKRPPASNSKNEGNNAKKGRLEYPPPNTPAKHDGDQRKHRMSVENNLKAALRNESYATDEFLRNLSLEVTTCFSALTTKVYLVSSIIESEPTPDFRKTTSTTSRSEKKGRGKKKKSDNTLSDLGPIPRQIDVMVNLFLSEVDNSVTGVLELLTRKQISNQFKDYNLNNKWLNFESLLGNVEEEIGRASLYGRNVVNYATIKKYMLFYREILVWYMKNVQYPPGPDNTSDGLFFHTKCQNGSPHDSKQYVNAMKNFLDCLMANSSLRVSLSHSYNQSERIFTALSLCHLDIKLLTHKDFYQYFLPELFQNSFVLGTTVLLGEKWVRVGFHRQGDTNVPKTGQVILPLHSSLVFHNVIHYKDTVSNYYNIHFKFNDDRVTLSPCKLGTGNIRLAPFTDRKGILYLVNEWLVRKVVDPCKNLGANVVRSLEPACIQFISQVLCASMIEVDVNDSSFDCLIDNVCKVIMPKVLEDTDNGCFGYDHMMETIEDLVLTKRRFLTGAILPKLSDENVAYFQRMNRLYIYPTAGVLSMTQFAHVNFEDTSEQLVTDILELSGLNDKHNNELVLQVVERYTWVEELILYSYLPEMGTIFTPLTEKLARYLLEKSDDLLSANILVEFLDDNVSGFIPPWVVEDPTQNNSNHSHTGTNKERGSPDTSASSTEKAKLSQPSGIDKPKGNSDNDGKGDDKKRGGNDEHGSTDTGNNLRKSNQSTQSQNGDKAKVSNVSSTEENSEMNEQDDINESEEEVPYWAIPLIRCQVTLTKFPLRTEGSTPYSYVCAHRSINVLLKEKDPEIMYPIYKINEQVRHADGGQFSVRIGEVSGYSFQKFMNYDACPGYDILFQKGKVDQACHWYLHFRVSPLNKTNSSTIKRVSDLVQCYRKDRGNCGEVLRRNPKAVTKDSIATNNNSSGKGDCLLDNVVEL
eukprot:jgi/Psemu1/18935/gm1.18935_g